MPKRQDNAGVTLIELLLGLAIGGLLLSAIAAAFHGSLTSYTENEKIARATQTARSVVNRMMRDIRGAAATDAYASQITVIPPEDGSGLQQVQYEFDSAAQCLYYRRTVSGATTSHVLIGGNDVQVTTFYATSEWGQDSQGVSCIKSVTVRLGFRIGGQQFAVTSSAAPRRNQIF